MDRLLYFIRKSYVAIIFIVLEIIAIRSYANSTPFTQARLLSFSHAVTGNIRNIFSSVDSYFSLRRENAALNERIAALENDLHETEGKVSNDPNVSFEYIPAKVIANSINRPHNTITINKGYEDGITENMSVLSPEGYAVGLTIRSSAHFSIAKSILNTDFRLSARLNDDNSIGSVHWNGGDPTEAVLENVSKYAEIRTGLTVYTAGFSHLFPEGVEIGTVKDFSISDGGSIYNCTITLSADLNRLQNVLVVRNPNLDEVTELEKNSER